MSLVRRTLWAASAAIVLTVARFVLSAVVARRLGVEGFGTFAYLQWLVDIAFLVCSIGTAGAAARYLAEYTFDSGKLAAFRRAWTPWAIAAPLLASLAACVGAVISRVEMNATQMVLLGAWAACSGTWAIRYAVNIARQRFSLVFASCAVFALVAVGGVTFLPLDLNMALAVMAVAHASSAAVLLVPQARVTVAETTAARLDLRTIRLYAVNIWITSLLWGLVWSRGEYSVMRVAVGDAGLGHYAAAMVLFGGAAQAVMLLVGAVAPELTRLLGEGSTDSAIRIARKFSDLQLMASATLAVALAGFSRPLVQAVFGPTYGVAEDALAILAPGLIGFAMAAQNHLLQMKTDARFNRNVSLVGLAILLALALLLTPRLGIEGGAVARSLALVAMLVLSLWKAHDLISETVVSIRNFAIALAIALLVAVAQVAGTMDLHSSVALTVAAIALLLFAIRDERGRFLALALLRTDSASP